MKKKKIVILVTFEISMTSSTKNISSEFQYANERELLIPYIENVYILCSLHWHFVFHV